MMTGEVHAPKAMRKGQLGSAVFACPVRVVGDARLPPRCASTASTASLAGPACRCVVILVPVCPQSLLDRARGTGSYALACPGGDSI